jgi:hypothetical protein
LRPTYLLLHLLQSESLPLFFLFASQLLLLFIHTTSACHMVLGLRQKILALTGLQACQCDIVPQAVSMDRQVVEVPVIVGKVLTKLVCNATALTDIHAVMNHEFGEIHQSQNTV